MDEPDRPRPAPGPRHAAPEPEEPANEPGVDRGVEPAAPVAALPRRHPTRRWVLAGALAVAAGAGGGVGARFLRPRHRPQRPVPPTALVAAAAAERALVADLVVTTGGTADVRAVVQQATADHRAHLAALEGLLGKYRALRTVSPAPGTPRTRAQLRDAEAAAATAGARRARALTGDTAALLASIAACEATHAELLR